MTTHTDWLGDDTYVSIDERFPDVISLYAEDQDGLVTDMVLLDRDMLDRLNEFADEKM